MVFPGHRIVEFSGTLIAVSDNLLARDMDKAEARAHARAPQVGEDRVFQDNDTKQACN